MEDFPLNETDVFYNCLCSLLVLEMLSVLSFVCCVSGIGVILVCWYFVSCCDFLVCLGISNGGVLLLHGLLKFDLSSSYSESESS